MRATQHAETEEIKARELARERKAQLAAEQQIAVTAINKEREEEITKQLTANNPNAPSNIARYSMKERTFKFEPMVEQLVMHYATDGYLLHQESDEAKRQVALEEMEAQAMAEWSAGGKPKEKKEGEEGNMSYQLSVRQVQIFFLFGIKQ